MQTNIAPPPIKDKKTSLIEKISHLFRKDRCPSHDPGGKLRDAIEEYVEESESASEDHLTTQEHLLLTNILKLRDVNVVDVMIPRAEIAALSIDTSNEELFGLLANQQFSRIPIYQDTLDHILGTIHIKDILRTLSRGEKIEIASLLTDVLIVSPSLPVLDLILEMRENSRHIALVVDEFGGIDGLVTIGDIIESIVGEIEDEHDILQENPRMLTQNDGSILADGRVEVTDFEDNFKIYFTDEEKEESDTLGGILCLIAGKVPARGEIIEHQNGLQFEVLDADPRRVNTIRISLPLNEEISVTKALSA